MRRTTAPQFAWIALQHSCAGDQMMMPMHFCNQEVDESLFGLTEFVGGCGAGRFYLAIWTNGEIDPCVFFPKTIRNVRTSDLEELWRHDLLLADLQNKDAVEGSCGSCEYRYHRGGCRARAHGYFGNPLAPDPGCINNIAYYTALKLTRTSSSADAASEQA